MAVDRGRFQPFKVGRCGVPVSILQYADDTLCIGEASVDNLWAIKAVLRGFEMASGLKVNFWKSCLFGMNVSNEFLTMASDFLNCRLGLLPFKYLGLPVGANPRLCSTWKPVVDAIKGRLCSWGNKYVSLGGRIVLINAVLNSLPIFYLSYLKMPVKVWHEVVKIQRNYFWGGITSRRKTCWVKWSEICKPKKEGGLGIKDLRLMNKSLLAKWRWKLLMNEGDLWKDIIVAKYGSIAIGNACLGEENARGGASVWWRDICKLDSGIGWFSQAATIKIGSGNTTGFWSNVWVGGVTLKARFPRLFGISTQQEKLVCEVGGWVSGVWEWRLEWRHSFFVWEEEIFHELMEVLDHVSITLVDDRWVWNPGAEVGFSVKSAYMFLDQLMGDGVMRSSLENFVFKFIWKSGVPSKVSALAWQLLLDRIPTRDNLHRRGIISANESRCPLCNVEIETTSHLFLRCRYVIGIWYAILRWLGVFLVLPPTIFMSYTMLVWGGSNKKRRKGFSVVWLAYIWAVWKARNDRIFNNVVFDASVVMNHVQRLSWQWFMNNTSKSPSLLYEWEWDPGECMML
jgi:hypothetical protein